MSKTIEIVQVSASEDSIFYELRDNTGLQLLKNETVSAWIKFHNAACFDFSAKYLPEAILALPVTLYLLPATWFYGVELVVPSIDKTLYDRLPSIYAAYSKLYGPFKKEWRGKVTAKTVIENEMPESKYDNIVFFSGGVDAVHAGINNPGKRNVLVTVPSIEGPVSSSKDIAGQNFLMAKSRLIQEFSAVTGSNWLMITNNFRADIFDEVRIQRELEQVFKLDSTSFKMDGFFGMKYLGNLLSSAPFAYSMGIRKLIMGSAYEQLEDTQIPDLSGADPTLSNSIKFAGSKFAEQDGLHTRRSQKVRNAIRWCTAHGGKIHFWVCYKEGKEQCCMCHKCVRTLLSILCEKQAPTDWGFENFNEKEFSKLIRKYHYYETEQGWIWDIIDSIDSNTVYPYCNETLHWLKKLGYKKYFKRAQQLHDMQKVLRIFKLHRYPHYAKKVLSKLAKKKANK